MKPWQKRKCKQGVSGWLGNGAARHHVWKPGMLGAAVPTKMRFAGWGSARREYTIYIPDPFFQAPRGGTVFRKRFPGIGRGEGAWKTRMPRSEGPGAAMASAVVQVGEDHGVGLLSLVLLGLAVSPGGCFHIIQRVIERRWILLDQKAPEALLSRRCVSAGSNPP